MNLTTRRIIGTAAVAAAFGLGSAAHAEDWKETGLFGWFGVGKAYQIEKGHTYWVGEFSGTFVNDKGEGSALNLAGVKCPGVNCQTTSGIDPLATPRIDPPGVAGHAAAGAADRPRSPQGGPAHCGASATSLASNARGVPADPRGRAAVHVRTLAHASVCSGKAGVLISPERRVSRSR
jgi:hypothetical protein